MNILKRLYLRLKYPGLPKKFIFQAYTNLVYDPADPNSGNWKGYPDTRMVFEGESLTIGNHEPEPQQTTFESLAFYDCDFPDDIKNEREIKAWLNKQEPIMEQKKNQQGKMITKYRIERYAKNSRMYKKEV